MSNIVLVEVRNGVSEFTVVPPDTEMHIVNWDSPESGKCAFCDGELTGSLHEMHYACRMRYHDILNTSPTIEIKAADCRYIKELVLKLEKLASAAEAMNLVKANFEERSVIEAKLAKILVGLMRDA